MVLLFWLAGSMCGHHRPVNEDQPPLSGAKTTTTDELTFAFNFDQLCSPNGIVLRTGTVLSVVLFAESGGFNSRYSCTEGEHWQTYNFSNAALQVDGVLNEPGINTMIVRYPIVTRTFLPIFSCQK